MIKTPDNYTSCLSEPYCLHRTNISLWRSIMILAITGIPMTAGYVISNFEAKFTNVSMWIALFAGLVLISNFKRILSTIYNPVRLLQFIWYPQIQFGADRNGMYFNNAYLRGQFPKNHEIVFVEWSRIELIRFETRSRRRCLVIKFQMTPEEERILGGPVGLTRIPFRSDELIFSNETPNEKKVIETLKYLQLKSQKERTNVDCS